MDIVFVTPELAPYRESSYASRSAAACAKALRQLGHRVTVLAPLFPDIDPGQRHLARRLARVEVELGDGSTHFSIYEGKTSGGVDLVLLGHPDLFAFSPQEGASVETVTPGSARAWGAFCRAAVQWMGQRESLPEVVQLYGWQTAPIALIASDDPALGTVPTVLSVHALGEPGVFEKSALSEFGIAPRYFTIDGVEFYGRFSTLKAGIQYASAIVVPGPTFAKSLSEPGAAGGLDGAFRSRGSKIAGIVDGVDVSVWNAATDPHLEIRFDAVAERLVDTQGGVSGKARCKAALLKQLGLPQRTDVPLLAYVGPASEATSLKTLVPQIVRNDVLVAIAIEGPITDEAAAELTDLKSRWTDRVAVHFGADQQITHQVLGGADVVLVPSENPCATRPMEAHRYGALPVALRLGLAADTVVDCDAELRSGTGFLVDGAGDEAFLGGVQRAVAAFSLGATFRATQWRAMLADHGWDRPARLHERLYRSLSGRALAGMSGNDAAPQA